MGKVEGTDALVKSVVRLTGFATIWVKWKAGEVVSGTPK
jgi:hypothetical protein